MDQRLPTPFVVGSILALKNTDRTSHKEKLRVQA
jgi:hypothetical protein